MADAAIFLGWNRPFQKHESAAFDALEAMSAFLNGLQKSGQITSSMRVWLEPHGGDLNGFALIQGEVSKLQAMKQTDGWNDLVAKLSLTLDGFGINHAIVGEGVTKEIERIRKSLG